MAEVKRLIDINKFGVLLNAKRLEADQILGPNYRTVEDTLEDTELAIPAITKYLQAQTLQVPDIEVPALNSTSISTSPFALFKDKSEQTPSEMAKQLDQSKSASADNVEQPKSSSETPASKK